jgi:hypothetical protein
MPWPTDHPALIDPQLAPWAAGLNEVVPGARVENVLRYLPGRRVTTLVEHEGELAVVKVFASPRARGNARRLRAFAASPTAALVPSVLGCDAAGHVLAITYRRGVLPASLSDTEYPACFSRVGAALRRIHDSGAELDRVWDWEHEVAQLRRHAVPATIDLVETLAASTGWLAGAPPSPAHRDCHPRQVVVAADGTVAFIDLDDAAMGPRGLDVGNMLGHLIRERITDARSARATVQASEAFLDGYGPCAELDEGVLTGWTSLGVARLAGLAESRHHDVAQRDALLAYCVTDLGRVADLDRVRRVTTHAGR